MKSLENNGIVVLNGKHMDSNEEKTIIVLGLPRSGTSMIGKVLYELGVFHDDGFLNKNVYEDKKAIEHLEKDINNLETYIREQNSKYKIWGFKRPGAYYYISKFIHKFRNPIFIVPFKDILSTSLRKNISIDMDFDASLKETLKQTNDLIDFIHQNNFPSILFSYEKAILNSEYFVNEIINVLSLKEVSKTQIVSAINAIAINPKEYLESSRIQISGRVETLKNGVLSGWAKANIDDRALDINVLDLNKNVIATTKASRYRKDLEENNIGKGYHSFEVEISEELTMNDIVVTAGKHRDKLPYKKN